MSLETVTIGDNAGIKAALSSLGASIIALEVPTVRKSVNVVLGYRDIRDFQSDEFFMEATCGRYAGRIRNGTFSLDGTRQHLTTNDKPRVCTK